MSGITLAVNLAISIAIILFLVLKFKINPVISMILASLYMGISCSLGFMDTITSINSGFGSLMTGIGFPIGFGIMMGQILEDSGAAESLAKSILKAFPGKKAPWALGLTAFLLSIPVFFDVTFVILIPLGIVGLAAAVFSMFVWFRMLDRPGFWDPNKDETGLLDMDAAVVHRVDLPSPWAAVIPICLPVLAILIGSFWPVVTGSDAPVVIQFISQKTIAILLGLLAAYAILLKRMGWGGLNESVSKSLKQAGVVLLITGAGGAFGAVIQATNIGEVLIAGLTEGQSSTMLILCLTFGIGVLFRVAQGSGTVASITAMTIMASVAPSAGCHPVYIALAALAGGNFIGHVNDSGFWVVTNLSGASVTGGLKTYTWNTITLAGMAFILSLVGATVLPMV